MKPRPRTTSRPAKVTSSRHSLVKVFRRALAAGETRDGLLAVEGPFGLDEALKAGERVRVASVLASHAASKKFRGLLQRLSQETELALAPDRLFEKIAATERPQGIASLVELKPPDLAALLQRPDAVLVVACGVQDPGNLGAIVRSAQALGACGLVTLKGTVSPYNAKASRASAGMIFHLPVFRDREHHELFNLLRDAGLRLIAADRESPVGLAQADLKGKIAFLVGRESTGLPEEVVKEADLALSIPIRPGMDSVNAATAAGILLYEAARQREFKYS